MLWPCVSKETPCPICGNSAWCALGDYKIKCMRVQSSHASIDGGWYHDYADKPKKEFVARERKEEKRIDALAIMREMIIDSNNIGIKYENISSCLGVSEHSLGLLETAWSRKHNAYAFPMRDGQANVIGIRLRHYDGFKWCVPGSHTGIFIPTCDKQKVVYLCEGPTNTAAALTMGLFAIGRPNNTGGGEYISEYLNSIGVRRAVIVADHDDKHNGLRPGLQGAQLLKKKLRNVSTVIWTPSVKDIRDFLIHGGTAQMIEDEIKSQVWTKG